MNFSDEVTAALRMCDGVMIFIDASEGVSVDWIFKYCTSHFNLAVIVYVNGSKPAA